MTDFTLVKKMKDWFKYRNGFVNLDKNNIYLTNSGNWSEALSLKEKGTQKQNNVKKFKIQLFIILSILFLIIYFSISSFKFLKYPLILVSPLGLYLAYRYLRTELGASFKLPISKVSEIQIEGSTVSLIFFNAYQVEDLEILSGVDNKGLQIMLALQTKIRTSAHI